MLMQICSIDRVVVNATRAANPRPTPQVGEIDGCTHAVPRMRGGKLAKYWRAAEAGPAQPGLAPPEAETGPDGEIIGGPRTPQQIAAQRRLQQTQAQVDEVVDIMKTNMDKVLDRDVKLSELDDRADALQYGASQFEQQAKSLKNKFWLQNLKMMIIMGVIGIVIIGLLFGKYM
ncbi:hypothetical protein SFRURICE_007889 [Spodoptera frugiperda]|nr:hypothetical protein SFRURICE_007889 [Spodoptera frugiperda]